MLVKTKLETKRPPSVEAFEHLLGRVFNLSILQRLTLKARSTACGTVGRPGPLEAGPNGKKLNYWGVMTLKR